ncbi:TPA: hypothetical protein I8525_004432 [Aeromonas hydrophila]|nr:hypothetical protein [Aeromonas hydrophila]
MNTVFSTSIIPSAALDFNTGLLIANFKSKKTSVDFEGDYETAVEFHNTRIEITSFDIETMLYGNLKIRISREKMDTEKFYTYLESDGEVGNIGEIDHLATYHIYVLGGYDDDCFYGVEPDDDIGWSSNQYQPYPYDIFRSTWEHLNGLSLTAGDEISVPFHRATINRIFEFAFERWMRSRIREEY